MNSDVATAPYLRLTEPTFSAMGEQLRAARAQSWYARTDFGVAVLRHAEAGALLKDRRLRQGSWSWPAQNGITEGVLADWWSNTLVGVEGDDHARLRRMLNPAFSKSAIAPLETSFRELAHDVIDQFAARGSCEFMSDFAEPFSSRALARLLGLAETEWRELSDLASDLGLAFGPAIVAERPRIEAAILDLYARAEAVVAQRRRKPQDDFVTGLLRNSGGEGGLTDREARDLITSLIFGGMDTTRSQLGLAMQLFVEHPDQWDLLGVRPDLGPHAVEEVIRFNPSIHWTTRLAVEDLVVHDLVIPEGTVVHLLTYATSTDPLAIGDEPFDISGARPPHYGFGGGRHHCLGHFVARLDMREALVALAQRLPGVALAGVPSSRPPTGNTGPLVLPLAFQIA